jgi:hypothetical protein
VTVPVLRDLDYLISLVASTTRKETHPLLLIIPDEIIFC